MDIFMKISYNILLAFHIRARKKRDVAIVHGMDRASHPQPSPGKESIMSRARFFIAGYRFDRPGSDKHLEAIDRNLKKNPVSRPHFGANTKIVSKPK